MIQKDMIYFATYPFKINKKTDSLVKSTQRRIGLSIFYLWMQHLALLLILIHRTNKEYTQQ